MKRILSVVLFACMVLACAFTAAAEAELPVISFAESKGNINGGRDYEVMLVSSAPVAADIQVTVQSDVYGAFQAVMPAGASEVTVPISTTAVEKRTSCVLTLAQGEGYQIAEGAKHTLQVYALPKVEFYRDANVGYVGKKLNVIVSCKNPAAVLSDCNVFELRDETGRVYGTRQWKNPSSRTNFTFDVTEDMLGRHTLSVWCGGVQVTSAEDGYCAITDLNEKIISTVETDEPYMCITLDCAYSDDQTIEILDILDKYNVKVTFFMTGHYVNTFTETAREMVARGHEIGNHSATHPNLATQVTSVNKRLEQIQSPAEDIQELLGVRVRLFRPPYGAYDNEVLAMVRAEGMEVTKWTIDSHDWDEAYKNDPERVYRRVTKDVKAGNIILFHIDGFNTPEVLDRVIPYYQNELGLNLVTVSELMEIVGRELPALPADEAAAAAQ